jgi:hypothetical protein
MDIDVEVGDPSSRALRHSNDSLSGEPLNGAPNRLSTDQKHARKFTLARELIPELQDTRSDRRHDLVAYHFLRGLLMDRFAERR